MHEKLCIYAIELQADFYNPIHANYGFGRSYRCQNNILNVHYIIIFPAKKLITLKYVRLSVKIRVACGNCRSQRKEIKQIFIRASLKNKGRVFRIADHPYLDLRLFYLFCV